MWNHLKVAPPLQQVHLVQPLVLDLLMPDVLANDGFVSSHRRDEVPTSPQVTPDTPEVTGSSTPRFHR